jgi:hypothetical protein
MLWNGTHKPLVGKQTCKANEPLLAMFGQHIKSGAS